MAGFEHLGPLLRHLVRRGTPGNVCMVSVDGKLRYKGCSGLADIENGLPVAPDTIFTLHSMTKPILCAAALRLFERGRFSLDDPLYEYLPEFRDAQVQRGPGADDLSPAKSPILIRHLFTMTSGYTYGEADQGGAAEATYKNLGGDFWNIQHTLREFCRRMAASPLAFDPGDGWRYGYSHDILGGLVETLAAKPLSQFMQEEIFGPLGMTDTSFKRDGAKADRTAPHYLDVEECIARCVIGVHTNADNPFESGGAGLLSTAADGIRFASALASGNALLGRKTIDLMRTNHLTARQKRDFDWPHYAGYGYGLGVRTMVDLAAGGSNGSVGEFGWCGAAGCWLLADPGEGLAAVYMQQLLPSGEPYFAPRLRAAIYGGLR